MSALLLVRHGQASFLSDDYDRLSPAGEAQATLLGVYLARTGARPDAIFTGPRVRQRRITELAIEAMARAGATCPEPVLLPELDEYPAEELFKRSLDDLRDDDPL